MTFLAIPNVSEGRDVNRITALVQHVEAASATVLDVHSDAVHHRSVLTVAGSPDELIAAMANLAEACLEIDLREHEGAHPRAGALDVCPIVPYDEPMTAAIALARRTGEAVAQRAHIPVYYYDRASSRRPELDLPSIRRGGLAKLIERARGPLPPDIGPPEIDPRHGVVCVGARDILIAFNVSIQASLETARSVATAVRRSRVTDGTLRTLAFQTADDTSQVSMNLLRPSKLGIDAAFELVRRHAEQAGVDVVATEVIGLVPERYQPDPKGKAARLLIEPSRSLEAVLLAF